MSYDSIFGSLSLDMIALESAILQFESANNIEEYASLIHNVISQESTKDDTVFGSGLFEEAMATEATIIEPAMEGVGEKIKNALKSIFNALKKFFKRLWEIFSKPFKVKQPEIEFTAYIDDKGNPNAPTAKFKSAEGMIKFTTAYNKVNQVRLSTISVIMNFLNSTHIYCKKIIKSINTIFDNIKQHSNQEPIESPEDYARRIHTHDVKGFDGKILTGGKDTVDKCIESRDKVKNATKQITSAFHDNVKSLLQSSDKSEEEIAKQLKSFLCAGIQYGKVSKVFEEITVQMKDMSKENLDFCDHMVSYCEKTLSTQNDQEAQAGFVLCKYYSTISHCYQDIAVCIRGIETGSVFTLSK